IEDKEVYRFNPNIENPKEEVYIELSEDANYFDFDENDNMYLGDRDGVCVVTPEKTETYTGYHEDIAIKQVRVFDGYVYVNSNKTIYKNQILDNSGSLGESQVVVDLESTSKYKSADIGSFDIDVNGMIILCLKNVPDNSIFVLENDGSITPYYKLKIMPSSVDQVVYGRSRYVYLNRGITLSGVTTTDLVKVYKMGMQYTGAPYWGRE
ncbi:MAG: hypothetical protein JW956_11265, partial [Calditrichaceae bacterium]|nr:hypothetical protein [Calditrichaceae bacterium]